MHKITIIGWQARTKTLAQIVSYWPGEIDESLAIAKASREADVNVVEEVLVEKVK